MLRVCVVSRHDFDLCGFSGGWRFVLLGYSFCLFYVTSFCPVEFDWVRFLFWL